MVMSTIKILLLAKYANSWVQGHIALYHRWFVYVILFIMQVLLKYIVINNFIIIMREIIYNLIGICASKWDA